MNPCPVLVGRQQELATLRSLLEAGGGVALISGEAGIGKSRLVREFAAEAEKAGRVVLWGRPEEVAEPGPYALVADLLESVAERGGKTVAAECRAYSSALMRPHDGEGEFSPPTPRSVAAEIRGLVSQLGSPPLIVLEDLHWADEASHSVSLHLARAASDDGHLILCSVRPEAAASGRSLGRLIDALARDRIAVEVEIGALSREETASMLEIMWGRTPEEEELRSLETWGEGVPFFLEELAATGPPDGSVGVPRTIEQSVAARLRDLGSDAAAVLKTASLLIGQLDVSVLAAANDLAIDFVTECLVEGVKAGLLADLEGRLTFRHALIRDAIARSVVSVEAANTHGRLARAIEDVHPNELDTYASSLARHYTQAGERDSAVHHAVRGGERALALAATGDARTAFSLALELTDGASIDALAGLAEVEFREGNEGKAAGLFRIAADGLKREGQLARAAKILGRLAWALQGRVEVSEVLDTLDEGLALPQGDSVEYAQLMAQKGELLCFLYNEPARATPILIEAMDVARAIDEHGIVAEALDGLAQAAHAEGRIDEALRLGAEAVEAATRSAKPESIGRTHHNHAVKLAAFGKPLAALDILTEGRKQMLQTYGRAAVGAMDVNQAWVMWLMGLPNEVAGLTARGRSAWQRWRGYRWLLEAWAFVERGETALARARTDEAWTEVDGDGFLRDDPAHSERMNFEAMQATIARALVRRAEGKAADALQLTSKLLSTAEPLMEAIDYAQLLWLHASASTDARNFDEIATAVKRLRELCERHPYPYIRALTFEVRGLLARQVEDAEEAASMLGRAISEFELCSNSSDRARCQTLLAGVITEGQQENASSMAIELLRESRDIASRCGALVEVNRTEAALRLLGIRPRAGRPRRDATASSALSPRESEVAAMVAAGETNADIASRLFLSARTVQDHITHALRKLGLSGRAGLASWAAKQGMI